MPDVFVMQILTLTQALETNIKGVLIEQLVSIYDDALSNLHYENIGHHLSLLQSAKVSKSIAVSALSVLSMTQADLPSVDVASSTDFLIIVGQAIQSHGPHIQQTLLLSQVAIAETSLNAGNTLTLIQSATVNFTRTLTIPQSLVIASNGNVYEDNVCWTSFPIDVVKL